MVDDKASEQPVKHALTPEMVANKWQKGQSGNPGGRPKTKHITDALKTLLEQEYLADGTTLAEHIAETVTKELLDPAGNLKHGYNTALLKELFDRTEGKVTDTHRFEGEVPVSIIYKKVEKKEP